MAHPKHAAENARSNAISRNGATTTMKTSASKIVSTSGGVTFPS
jgi:hypothetical protein